jgi:hypothetical protein
MAAAVAGQPVAVRLALARSVKEMTAALVMPMAVAVVAVQLGRERIQTAATEPRHLSADHR